jgi:flavin-binding protein dodecin
VLIDLAFGATGSVLGLAAVFNLNLIPWRDYPLLVEHAVKSLVVFVAILAWSIAKVSEISANSNKSFEDAIVSGIARANKTLRNMTFSFSVGSEIPAVDSAPRWPGATS